MTWSFLRRYARRSERFLIGLMSGTSADGVDAALVRISGSGRATQATVQAHRTTPYSEEMREQIIAVASGYFKTSGISTLNVALGHLFADAAEALLEEAEMPLSMLDAVASHGQTVSHTPWAEPHGATLQIGEAAVIARRLGVPVVSDFRAADVAAGGQGAPLVPYADWCLLTHPTRSRAIQNIGGIANVTYLPARAHPQDVMGFDTGPGNMPIDTAADRLTTGRLHCDLDGRMAALGTIDSDLLVRLLVHPFLRMSPPKSAGREEFGEEFVKPLIDAILARSSPTSARDLITTLTAFTAYSIYDAYRTHLPAMPDEVIVGGGGAHNPTLMRMLRDRFEPISVLTHEDVGIPGDAKEALAFAVLANETLLGSPGNLPAVTGASQRVILGKLTVP
jgi:anhydro-N-acetylmuramic acid kinase